MEHVKAEKDKKICHLLKNITEGNEKADELAKAGAMLDEGFMAQARVKHGPAGKRRSVCSIAVCSQLSLIGERLERLRRTCAAAKREVDLRG